MIFTDLASRPIAIISDAHANLTPLENTLQDIREQGIDRIVCLGDLVGYGKEPREVVDLVRKSCNLSLLGNHDFLLLTSPYTIEIVAVGVAKRKKHRMKPKWYRSWGKGRERWDFLNALKPSYEENDHLLVHASPRDPIREYIFPDRMPNFNPQIIQDAFELIPRVCFCGHTHYPVVIQEDAGCWYPEYEKMTFRLNKQQKYIINPGSISRPRDGNLCGSYIVYNGEEVTYRRVSLNA